MKIRTLTPVHIGTGIEEYSFLYTEVDNRVERHDMKSALESLPTNQILDERFLQGLADKRNQQAKKDIARLIKQKGMVLYSLDNYRYEKEQNVSVQMKNMNNPYIPGSTIKGVIINAILYDFLLKRTEKTEIIDDIKKVFRSMSSKDKKLSKDEKNAIRKKLGFGIAIFKEDSDFNKMYMEYYGPQLNCLVANDISFERMGLYSMFRYGKKKMPLNDVEAIIENQYSTTTALFSIDYNRLRKLGKNNYLSKYLDENIIFECLKKYTKAIINEEIDILKYIQNTCKDDCNFNDAINDLKGYTESSSIILRVGKQTDYYSKTVSMIFKNKYPDMYKNEFYRWFSPVGFSSNPKFKSRNPDPYHFPRSKAIIELNDYDTVPGYLEIVL